MSDYSAPAPSHLGEHFDVDQQHKEPSSSLPTPPTTTTSPPASLTLHDFPPPPPPHAEQQQPLPPAVSPPSPQVTPALPSLPSLAPPHLQHQDSASSLNAQPPTPAAQPLPPAIAPPQFTPEPAPLPPVPALEQSAPIVEQSHPQLPFVDQAEQPVPYTNGFHHGEADPVEVPIGAHPGLGSLPHPDGQSAVDVLADVAMGEAALDLADFAAGAGSGDVRGGSPALPAGETAEFSLQHEQQQQQHYEVEQPAYSPSLKRTADEAAEGEENGGSAFEAATANRGLNGSSYGAYGSLNGGVEAGVDEREAKRSRVEAEPSPALAASSPVDSFNPFSLAAPSVVQPSPDALSASLPPILASHLPAPSPTPSAPAVQGYDPSAFTIAPTLASSAPPYPPPSQPLASLPTTMPTSDLHTYHNASPHIAPPSAASPTISPVPPTPQDASTPQPPLYAPPNFFDQQPQASTSSGLPQQPHQYPSLPLSQFQHQPSPHNPYGAVKQEQHDGQISPLTNGGEAGPPPPPAGPPPPPPIHVLNKEQQKFAINMIRNLKRNKNAPPFLKPVDPVALLIPDYPKVILNPMDLGTLEARLQATGKAMAQSQKMNRIYGLDYSLGREGALWEGQVPAGAVSAGDPPTYRTIEEFKNDLDRIWDNCFKYNGPREKNPVSAMAGIMMDAANKSFRGVPFAPAVSPYPPPPEPKKEPFRGNAPFVPNIRHSSESSRPKREIHAPVKDLAYLESAGLDPTAGGIYNLSGIPGMHGGGGGMAPPKPRKNNGVKMAQEQLRFCKEVVKELFKKVHEAYAYPFYQPVDLAAYPTYAQYVKRPMDLSTIRTRLEHNQYPTPPYAAFENDVRTIFKNCYAFNPPGTAVNDWGHRLEAVFEHKWDERPMAFEDDSGDEDPAFMQMEQQLQMMQANLEMMKATKKAEKEQKRYQQMQQRMSAPKPPKPPPQPQPNPYAMSAYASAPPPMPRHTSGGGPKKHGSRPGGGGGGGGGTHKKKKKRHDDDSDDYYDDDDGGAYYGGSTSTTSRRRAPAQQQVQYEEYVDFEMKRELAVKIVAFQDAQLEQAIDIIRRGRPELLGAANEEIELDIDQLDQYTLLTLYRFVCPDSKPAVRPVTAPAGAAKAPKQGGGGGPGGNRNQRKNLDEEKEAERIEMLEARLKEFEQGEGAGTPAAYGGGDEEVGRRGSEVGLPTAVHTAGDDVASSDSSDGDSDDDSSDED